MYKVGIIGATGYAGCETTRLVLQHPELELTVVTSKSFTDKKIADIYPSLSGITDLVCVAPNVEDIWDMADVFFTALPHGASVETVAFLVNKGKKVIDLSADYRYSSIKTYNDIYNINHSQVELNDITPYGLPELFRDTLKGANVISNPGCYPTCSILGIAPLIANGLIDLKDIIVNACSGVSGAGRNTKLMYQFCECTENMQAYKVAAHRHTSEIEEKISLLSGKDVKITFTPHLVPMKRGMLATIYANLIKDISSSELTDIYKEYYKNEFFVRVMENGIYPNTKNVAGSNFVDIGVAVDKKTNKAIVLSAIDNVGKGAAGQAIQNLNIMYGFDEKLGLTSPSLYI